MRALASSTHPLSNTAASPAAAINLENTEMKQLVSAAIFLLAANTFAQSPAGVQVTNPSVTQGARDGTLIPVPTCSPGTKAVASISVPAGAALPTPGTGSTDYSVVRDGDAWRVSIRHGDTAARPSRVAGAVAEVQTMCMS
jgi:hypothetical protein